MKFGVRTPSLKKSIKARTTGRAKRALKRSVNPLYGKRGMGLINNPKKAVYNKVYDKTTVSAIPKGSNTKKSSNTKSSNTQNENNANVEHSTFGCIVRTILVFIFLVILFNGKPLLNKAVSFLVFFLISKVITSIFGSKPKKTNSTDYPNSITPDSAIDDIGFNQYELYLNQLNDSIKIINTTKNPETFFSRYSFLLERLDQLIEISTNHQYSGENTDNYLEKLQENKTSIFNDFINRYYDEVLLKINNLKTKKAKINNATKFKDTLFKHENYLEPENIETINELYIKLQENI